MRREQPHNTLSYPPISTIPVIGLLHLWQGPALLGSFEVATTALRILLRLSEAHPAVGPSGQVLQPLPRVHRTLAAPGCLPHLCQVRSWTLTHACVITPFSGVPLAELCGANKLFVRAFVAPQ